MPSVEQPGCYFHAATTHESGQRIFPRTLCHLGRLLTRTHHPEDDRSPKDVINRLTWKGRFGPVAAAIKLSKMIPVLSLWIVRSLCTTILAFMLTMTSRPTSSSFHELRLRQRSVRIGAVSGRKPQYACHDVCAVPTGFGNDGLTES